MVLVEPSSKKSWVPFILNKRLDFGNMVTTKTENGVLYAIPYRNSSYHPGDAYPANCHVTELVTQ